MKNVTSIAPLLVTLIVSSFLFSLGANAQVIEINSAFDCDLSDLSNPALLQTVNGESVAVDFAAVEKRFKKAFRKAGAKLRAAKQSGANKKMIKKLKRKKNAAAKDREQFEQCRDGSLTVPTGQDPGKCRAYVGGSLIGTARAAADLFCPDGFNAINGTSLIPVELDNPTNVVQEANAFGIYGFVCLYSPTGQPVNAQTQLDFQIRVRYAISDKVTEAPSSYGGSVFCDPRGNSAVTVGDGKGANTRRSVNFHTEVQVEGDVDEIVRANVVNSMLASIEPYSISCPCPRFPDQ